jgi:hypothetical protein
MKRSRVRSAIKPLATTSNHPASTGPIQLNSSSGRCRQDQMNILLTEMTLLRDLALVPQPKALVEAAVQLALLFNSMGYELDTDDVEEMRTGFKKARRATAGLARAVAAAAGVDLTEFGELDMVSLMDQKCPELGPTEQADQHPDIKW